MPQITTYIRKDDMSLWLALPNKSEAIHTMLHSLKGLEPSITDEINAQQFNKDEELHNEHLEVHKALHTKIDTQDEIDPELPPIQEKAVDRFETGEIKGNKAMKDFLKKPTMTTVKDVHKERLEQVTEVFGKGTEDVTKDVLGDTAPDPDTVVQSRKGEKKCCEGEAKGKYCQHWQWDMERGDRYTNQYSGRISYVPFAG